jgi:predicted RNA methylase
MPISSITTRGAQKIRALVRKADRSFRRRGLGGTVKFLVLNLPSVVKEILPGRRRLKQAQSDYDRKYHVDTSGEIHLSELDIESPNSAFGNSYQASPPNIIAEMIVALSIRYQDYTFIDIGSGKGLVLFIASNYPFRKIIGVEFSPQLHQIAQENVRSYRSAEQQCMDIELVLNDATQYKIPDGPLVLYMFNPFNEKIVRTLVTNIRASIEKTPRPVFILYKNPVANLVFEENRFVKKITLTREYAIYKCEQPENQ